MVFWLRSKSKLSRRPDDLEFWGLGYGVWGFGLRVFGFWVKKPALVAAVVVVVVVVVEVVVDEGLKEEVWAWKPLHPEPCNP